jgi:hypothetical protein
MHSTNDDDLQRFVSLQQSDSSTAIRSSIGDGFQTVQDVQSCNTARSDYRIEGYEQGISQYAIFQKVYTRYFASYLLETVVY